MSESVLVVAGPTASGKSSRALHLARTYDGCIINADSIQLYEGLPLLTAQPTISEQAEIPHALYGIFPAHSPLCSVAQWLLHVQEALQTCRRLQKRPIIVGGTGFYIQALMQGLSPIPDVDPSLREDFDQHPLAELYKILSNVDLETAVRVGNRDRQRIIRALTVWRSTGRTLSFWQKQERRRLPYTFQVEILLPERTDLIDAIEKRLHRMIDSGVFEEVLRFMDFLQTHGLSSPPVARAIGFSEIRGFWLGQWTREFAIQRIREKTAQYAKRQRTWWRHQKI